MGRWSTYQLRSAPSVGSPSEVCGPGIAPGQPDPVTPLHSDVCEEGRSTRTCQLPGAMPSCGATFELLADSDYSPPTTVREADIAPSAEWTSYCEGDGHTVFVMVRCWNAEHDAYTDSEVIGLGVPI